MGQEVSAKEFSREDRQRYRQKVRTCLDVFAQMLAEARFDSDRRSGGLEIELNPTDDAGAPAFTNARVLERVADPDFVTELGQFNVEINIAPRLLEGRVMCGLGGATRPSLNPADDRAREAGDHMMIVGILPTVTEKLLNGEVLTANPRYE